jgi:hypothetical protein
LQSQLNSRRCSGIKDGAKECENVTYFGKISHKTNFDTDTPSLMDFSNCIRKTFQQNHVSVEGSTSKKE